MLEHLPRCAHVQGYNSQRGLETAWPARGAAGPPPFRHHHSSSRRRPNAATPPGPSTRTAGCGCWPPPRPATALGAGLVASPPKREETHADCLETRMSAVRGCCAHRKACDWARTGLSMHGFLESNCDWPRIASLGARARRPGEPRKEKRTCASRDGWWLPPQAGDGCVGTCPHESVKKNKKKTRTAHRGVPTADGSGWRWLVLADTRCTTRQLWDRM